MEIGYGWRPVLAIVLDLQDGFCLDWVVLEMAAGLCVQQGLSLGTIIHV